MVKYYENSVNEKSNISTIYSRLILAGMYFVNCLAGGCFFLFADFLIKPAGFFIKSLEVLV